MVAIKKTSQEGLEPSTLRELNIFTKLDHPNILKMLDYSFNLKEKSMYIVLEYVDHDLNEYLKLFGKKLTNQTMRSLMN